MEPEHTNNDRVEGPEAPRIGLTLELETELLRLLSADDSVMMQMRSIVEHHVARFIATLGIPGVLRLVITEMSEPSQQTAHSEDASTGKQFLRLLVHGQECAYPDDVLRSVYCYMELSLLLVEATPAYILSWLQKLLRETGDTEDSERTGRVAEFLGLACVEILKIRPSVLLTLPQVADYCALLATIQEGQNTTEGRKLPQPDWVLPILQTVLDMYLSLANVQAVAFALSYSIASESSSENTGEELIAYLLAQHIEIQMPRDYLKELTMGNTRQDRFIALRKELFDESGIRYPDFRFVTDEHLKPGCFAFKLNAITTLPFVGLDVQKGLQRAPLSNSNADALSIINPLSREVESLVELEPEDLNSFSSKQLDYFLLCLKATLKKHRALFVHRNFVADQSKRLKDYFPILVNTLKAKISDEQLTRILRALVMENISIRDLHFLFERLLDFLYMSADPEHNSVLVYWMTAPRSEKEWANTPENAVSFLQECMKRGDILSV